MPRRNNSPVRRQTVATLFHLELVTPERVLFSGQAEEVSLRSDGGEIAFLANHADYVGAVDITVVRIDAPQAGADATATRASEGSTEPLRVAVHGGFVEVKDNKVVIL